MDDVGPAVDIRHRVEGIGEEITPRQLRDFINQMPEEALDRPILRLGDRDCLETTDADFRDGHLNLY